VNETPLVSILMNCYNGEKYLQEAINSILNQTYKNWELVFWDNQSTDKSAEIFLSNKDPRLFYYFSPIHTRLGDARILATNKIKGDWIAIIDTDDLWEPNKLTKQIYAITNTKTPSETVGLVYCKAMVIDKNSVIKKELCHKDFLDSSMPEGRILQDLLFKGNFITSPSILINTKIFLSIGGFPKGYSHASDYYISCAIASKANIICVDEYLAHYRIHDNNNTQKDKVISYEEQLKIFLTWSKYIDAPLIEKNIRIKQLHTFVGLMMIKYNNQLIKGLFIIFRKGALFYAIKNVVLELKKLLR
jgi:glycosyltransferase involved in cell wall biosynthesis